MVSFVLPTTHSLLAQNPPSALVDQFMCLPCLVTCVCVDPAGDGGEAGGGAERDWLREDDPSQPSRLPQMTHYNYIPLTLLLLLSCATKFRYNI